MALSVTVTGNRLEDVVIKETALNNAGIENVTGASGRLYHFSADSADSSNANHIKIYDQTTATASTDPDIIIPIPASGEAEMVCREGIPFTNGLSLRSSREAGTSGTTDPGGNVTIYLVAN